MQLVSTFHCHDSWYIVPFLICVEAEGAQKALDGRWVGGKMIRAELYDQEKFDANDLSR